MIARESWGSDFAVDRIKEKRPPPQFLLFRPQSHFRGMALKSRLFRPLCPERGRSEHTGEEQDDKSRERRSKLEPMHGFFRAPTLPSVSKRS